MRFYGLSDERLLKMPLRRFWLLNKNIDRLRAEEDLRMLSVALHAASGESAGDLSEKLMKQMGTVVEFDEAKRALTQANAERDRDGLMALKHMGRL
jgi:hypothetical protein